MSLEDIVGLGSYFFRQAADLAKYLNLVRESNLYEEISENFEELIIHVRETRRNIEESKELYNLFEKKEIKKLIYKSFTI